MGKKKKIKGQRASKKKERKILKDGRMEEGAKRSLGMFKRV